MTDSLVFDEHPSCLVCQRVHPVQVTVDVHGNRLTCIPQYPEIVRVLPAPEALWVVCTHHAGVDVAAALAAHLSEGDEPDHDHDHHHGHEHH